MPTIVDKRRELTTGHYHTREELETAVRRFAGNGLSYAEVGGCTGVSEGTVYRILRDMPKAGQPTLEERLRAKDAYLRDTLDVLWTPTEPPEELDNEKT